MKIQALFFCKIRLFYDKMMNRECDNNASEREGDLYDEETTKEDDGTCSFMYDWYGLFY